MQQLKTRIRSILVTRKDCLMMQFFFFLHFSMEKIAPFCKVAKAMQRISVFPFTQILQLITFYCIYFLSFYE